MLIERLTLNSHKRRAALAKVKIILICKHGGSSVCVDVCHYTPLGGVCQVVLANSSINCEKFHMADARIIPYAASVKEFRLGGGASAGCISPTATALNILGLIASKSTAAVKPACRYPLTAERANVAHPSCSVTEKGGKKSPPRWGGGTAASKNREYLER